MSRAGPVLRMAHRKIRALVVRGQQAPPAQGAGAKVYCADARRRMRRPID
jgi:hypothetical protein